MTISQNNPSSQADLLCCESSLVENLRPNEHVQFDISEIEKAFFLKACWDRKFDMGSKKRQGKFDYQQAEKAVEGYVGIFCEREINCDFSVDQKVEFFYNKDHWNRPYFFEKMINEIKNGTYLTELQKSQHLIDNNNQMFLNSFQNFLSRFEFNNKKSLTFTGKQFLKLFQNVKEIYQDIFDDFYGKGSFESIFEDMCQAECIKHNSGLDIYS
jgi:hypothetical protein